VIFLLYACDKPGTLRGYERLSVEQCGVCRFPGGPTLISHLTQRSKRGAYGSNTNKYEDASSNGCNSGPDERPSINVAMILFLCFGFGGLLLGFLPLYWCLLMPESVNYQRTLFCASWIGGLCAAGSIISLFLWGVYPYTWGLPPSWLPKKWNPCEQNKGSQHGQTVSQKLLTSRYFPYYDKCMANVLSTDKQIGIISALCEGSSIRSIERMTGVHRDTIMRLGVKVGEGCAALMDAEMRNLNCTRLEMDEIWGFVGAKARNVRPDHFDDGGYAGDVWTFCAIDADTKLVPAFMVGQRDKATASAFVDDIASRMRNRVQISTDGLAAYVDAISEAFGRDVDYAQIVKTYGQVEATNNRRYSAPEFVSSEKHVIIGSPDKKLISTSYVERLNATTRLHMRRLTRLTLAFSKKLDNFEAAVGLHFAYYNFVLRHATLKTTPAVAAGVAASQWSVGELLEQAV
jgi:IS1 family transposase